MALLYHLHKNESFPSCNRDVHEIAIVYPIHKCNSKDDPNNFRPISTLSNISKIFEYILYKQMSSYFSNNNL